MAIAPFLALNTRNGAPFVKRYVNSSPTNTGIAITGAAADDFSGTGVSEPYRGYPAVVRFGGSRFWLAIVGSKLFRSTDGGASWTTVIASLTGLVSTIQTIKAGLWVMHVGGVATAVAMWADNGGNHYAATSTNGITWTTVGPFASPVADATYGYADVAVWQGQLVGLVYSVASNAYYTAAFDPASATMSFSSTGSNPFAGETFVNNGALSVYNNRLFFITGAYGSVDTTSVSTVRLWEVSGGAVIHRSLVNGQTTIAAGSHGAVLPQGTINVASTTGFPISGSLIVLDNTNVWKYVTYTNVTGTSFTGCSGGSGTLATGGIVYNAHTTTSQVWKFGLFADHNAGTPKLFAIWLSPAAANGDGWHATKFDSALARTDVTPTVFSGVAEWTTSASSTGRVGVIVDHRTTPGTTAPKIYLMLASDGAPGTAFTQWLWPVGGASVITPPSGVPSDPTVTGGSADQSLPYVKHTQGATYWTFGEFYVEQKGTTPSSGGLNISYSFFHDMPVKPTTAAGAAGNVDVGTHLWAVAYKTAAGIGPLGAVSTSLNITTSAKQVAITAIATGGGGVTERLLYRTKANTSTTVAAGSNGAVLPQSSISVASTTGFASSGTFYVTDNQGNVRAITYTGVSGGNTFTGCAGGTGGVLATGGAVAQAYYLVPTASSLADNTTTSLTDNGADSGLGAQHATTATASVRAWQGTEAASYPMVAATTTPASPLAGILVDNATVNTIKWEAATDGFTAGQRPKFVLAQV